MKDLVAVKKACTVTDCTEDELKENLAKKFDRAKVEWVRWHGDQQGYLQRVIDGNRRSRKTTVREGSGSEADERATQEENEESVRENTEWMHRCLPVPHCCPETEPPNQRCPVDPR